MENKIEIIKEIVKHHPGYGVDKGYSWYEGGMRDTGDWTWGVMIEKSDEELSAFLDYLKIEDEKVEKQRLEMERVGKLPKEEQDKYYKEEMKKAAKAWEELTRDIERKLIWGK